MIHCTHSMLVIFFFIFICQFNNCVIGVTNIGPADIVIENIEPCEDQSIYSQPYDISFHKINRTHVAYKGCYNFPTPMDVTYRINLTAAKWGDGGWKPNAFDYEDKDLCKILMTHVKDLWNTIQRHFGVEEKCPMSAGNYCVNDLVAPLDNMFPSMLYGRFRADIMLHINNDPFLCFRAYVNSVKAKDSKHPF